MDPGARGSLDVERLAACMPWFVDNRLDRTASAPASERCRPVVERVLAMTRADWNASEPTIRAVDAELSKAAVGAGELLYTMKFNASMGVRSDYYLAEEQGIEWHTAAAKPVPERLAELALAAAANEVC